MTDTASAPRPQHVAFVGAGNMAAAIIGGLLTSGYPAEQISAGDPSPAAQNRMQALGVNSVFASPAETVKGADVVLLAVKPQIMADVARSIAAEIAPGAVVVSIAAGIGLDALQGYLGSHCAVVRCMPNTPALVGAGATGLYAPPGVSPEQCAKAAFLLGAVGMTTWVAEESLLDAVIAVSGSGPAYFFAFMEAMIHQGVKLGLDEASATALTLQTALGAAKLAAQSEHSLATLRENVTSPGGTTEQALQRFAQEGALEHLVASAMTAAVHRAGELSKEYS